VPLRTSRVNGAAGIGRLQIMPKASTVRVHDSFTKAMGWGLNWGKNTKALFDQDRTLGG
jgi:hypothetical protein